MKHHAITYATTLCVLVLVDAVDGTVIQHLVEDNPEEWAGAR